MNPDNRIDAPNDIRAPRMPHGYTRTSLTFSAFGLLCGWLVYGSGRGAGFEGWFGMVFGIIIFALGMAIALGFALAGLVRRERPGWLVTLALAIPASALIFLFVK